MAQFSQPMRRDPGIPRYDIDLEASETDAAGPSVTRAKDLAARWQLSSARRATELISARRVVIALIIVDQTMPARPNGPGSLRLRFSNARAFFGHAAR